MTDEQHEDLKLTARLGVQSARREMGMTSGRKAIWITFVVSAILFGTANLLADEGKAPDWLGPVLNIPLALSFLCLIGGVGKR